MSQPEPEQPHEHEEAGEQPSDDDEYFVGQEDEVVEDMEGPPQDMEEEEPDDARAVLSGHAEPVYAVAWNPASPQQLASGSGDNVVALWEADSGESRQLEGHTDTVHAVAFSRDGALLATGSLDGKVAIWEVGSGRLLHVLEGEGEGIEWLAWHPRGNVLAAGGEGVTVWLWNAQSAACLQVLSGHEGAVRCGLFTPDGRTVVSAGGEGDASLRVWDPKTGEATLKVQGALFHGAGITALAVSPDGALAATGDEEGGAFLTTLATGKVVGALAGAGASVEQVAFLGEARGLVAAASLDGSLRLYEAASRTLRATCAHPQGVPRFALHPEQPLIFTACLDGQARCWDQRSGALLRTWRGHQAPIQDIAVQPSGGLLATGADDHTVRLFDAAAEEGPS